jgi:hypothetical protein
MKFEFHAHLSHLGLMEYNIYFGSKKATKIKKTKHKENMHAPIFQDPKKIQFRQKPQEYKEV